MTKDEIKKIIEAGDVVEELLTSYDWITYIKPIINKIIVDGVGGYNGTEYIMPAEDAKGLTPDKIAYNMGWSNAMVYFMGRIKQYITDRDNILKIEEQPYEDMNKSSYEIDYGVK